MEDDFGFDETTAGVDEETVRTILAGKNTALDAMEAFDIFDLCGESRLVQRSLPRDGKTFRKATS